jgi:hypothetical protein
MNHDELRKLAESLSHDAYYSGYYDGVANGESVYRGEYLEKKDLVPLFEKAILTACTREAELAAEAMKERCAEAIDEESKKVATPGYAKAWSFERASNLVRSLSPSDVLAEHDRQVRLSEAEWWFRAQTTHDEETGKHVVSIAEMEIHIAALRQPTAVKEKTNGR